LFLKVFSTTSRSSLVFFAHFLSSFLYFIGMSTPERPTNFPPKETLSGEVWEFVGSPSRPDISDGSGYHIPSPPSVSEFDDERLFEAFGDHTSGIS
jgi:hypothetical protein